MTFQSESPGKVVHFPGTPGIIVTYSFLLKVKILLEHPDFGHA